MEPQIEMASLSQLCHEVLLADGGETIMPALISILATCERDPHVRPVIAELLAVRRLALALLVHRPSLASVHTMAVPEWHNGDRPRRVPLLQATHVACGWAFELERYDLFEVASQIRTLLWRVCDLSWSLDHWAIHEVEERDYCEEAKVFNFMLNLGDRDERGDQDVILNNASLTVRRRTN